MTRKEHSAAEFFRRYAAWFGLLLTAVLCAAVLLWARYDLSSQVDDTPVFEIVNDVYDKPVELPREGELLQTLTLESGQRLYGVRLDVATYDYAFHSGALRAELRDAAGQVLAAGETPCIVLRDNTFETVIFSAPFTAGETKTFRLALSYATTAPEDEGQPLGLWVSEGQQGTMTLTDSRGTDLNATAALQFVVDYSGHWSRVVGKWLSALLFGGVVLCFAALFLLGQVLPKLRLELAYLAAALLLGGAFSLLTPPLVAPDEYSHLAKSYQMAVEALNGGAPCTEDGRLMIRECDAPYFGTATGEIGIFAYKIMAEHLAEKGCPAEFTVPGKALASTGRGIYANYQPQGRAIALAFRLGLGFHGMLLLARLANLLFYVCFTLAAVWFAPKHLKALFACVGLLPMSLQMAASLSPDAQVLSYAFLFAALCLRLREKSASVPEKVVLVVVGAALGPIKAIYVPLVLLVLLIPTTNLNGKRETPLLQKGGFALRQGALIKALTLGLALLLWCVQNLSAVFYAARDVDYVGLQRAAAALAVVAAVLLAVYWKIRCNAKAKKCFFLLLAVGVCAAIPVGIYKLSHMWGGLTPEALVGSIQANGDSSYTYSFGYICRNLPGTCKLLLRSVNAQGALWLQGVVGTVLGEPIVYEVAVSWLLTVALVLVLLCAVLRGEETAPRLQKRLDFWGVAFVLAAVVGLTVLAALTWTPINYVTIFGVQGRYWLPVLPLALLLLGENRAVAAKKDLSRPAVFAMTALTSLVILQGYGLYAAWQM